MNKITKKLIVSINKTEYILIIVLIFVCFLLLSGLSYLLIFNNSSSLIDRDLRQVQRSSNRNQQRVRVIATGDMIPHDAINNAAKQSDGSYEYSTMFGDMKQLFDKADVRFCNQATLAGGVQFGISGYPKFNAPTEFSRDIAELGCNVINTGSNHTHDYNQDVIAASVNAWKGIPNIYAVAGSNAVPEDKQKVRYFDKNGIKFAFVSYTTYSNEPLPNDYGVTMYSKALAERQLNEARTKADMVIVSMRWGMEYSPTVTTQQNLLAKEIANLGADLVFGHGPHVLQPVEEITLDDGRKSYIWYSLGNFLNAQLESETLFNGIAVIDIDISTKKVKDLSYLPIYMHYEWSAEDKMSGRLLARSNFSMYTFEDGQSALLRSQNNTSFEAQRKRIADTLQSFMPLRIITKDEYLQS